MREGWRRVSLGDIADTSSGSTPKAGDARYYEVGTVPFVKIADLPDGPVRDTDTSVTEEAVLDYRLKRLPPDTLLVAMYGSIGKVGLLEIEATTNQAILAIRPKSQDVLAKYLFYFFLHHQLHLLRSGFGGVQKNLSQRFLRKLDVVVPPLEEQRRIVDLVGVLDRALDAQRQLVNATRASKQRLLMAAFSSTDGAPQSTVSDLLEDSVGGVWGGEPEQEEIDVGVVRSTNFDADGFLTLSEAAKRSITEKQLARRALKAGDILLEKSGGGPNQPVGRAVFVTDDAPTTVCSNFVQLLRPRADVNPRWLFYLLWLSHAAGATLSFQAATTGIRNLRTNDYLGRVISLPDRVEQERVGELGAGLDDEIKYLQLHGERLEVLRRALLNALISGEHGIPESYDRFLGGASQDTPDFAEAA